jgi:hypothetical protein
MLNKDLDDIKKIILKQAQLSLEEHFSNKTDLTKYFIGADVAKDEKKYTREEMAHRLNNLFDRIMDSKVYEEKSHLADYERWEDIRYVGQCEGILKSTGDLPPENMKELNNLWKKYKTT